MKRALAVLPVAMLIAACGSGHTAPAPAVSAPPAQAGVPVPASGPAGTSYHDGPLTVTVDSVKVQPQLNAPGGIPDPERSTNGQWAVIHVTEQNAGQVPVEPGQVYVKTADGTTWDGYALGDTYGQELPRTPVAAGDKAAGLVLVDMPKGPGAVVYADGSRQVVYRWTFQ